MESGGKSGCLEIKLGRKWWTLSNETPVHSRWKNIAPPNEGEPIRVETGCVNGFFWFLFLFNRGDYLNC